MRSPMNRRAMLQTVAAAGASVSFLPLRSFAANSEFIETTVRYLESLARPDGGYAFADQEQSHLTSTFAVIGVFRALNGMPPRKRELGEFVRTHHPSRLKKLEQERRSFEFQQAQALAWLGEEFGNELRNKVSAWIRPLPYLKQYEQHGYPVFQSEAGAFACRKLMGLPLGPLAGEFTSYVDARRRPNGSFNNTPANDGGDGHVMNTWWGLRALDVLGRSGEHKSETVAWLRDSQTPGGGFTFSPEPVFGGVDDAAYTWAAVRALNLLGAEPRDAGACITYLKSLRNADGGFADRPGWLSNPLATYYAVDALALVNALETFPPKPVSLTRKGAALPGNLKVFSIQIEAHGTGSPSEAVDLARHLRIHLWGAKNAKPEWLGRAQQIADAEKAGVTFFASNEEYGTWVNVPGMGTYSHTSDIIAPATSDIGASLAKAGVVTWPEFKKRRLEALARAGGRLLWQFGENEELVRMFLDDSVEHGGYAAISTFHFGNPDFTNSEPFLHRWRGRIPYIALQDAHGAEPWWFGDMTTGFRTLFLGTEPTWEAWVKALQNNWVAAARHDVWSGNRTWLHTGSDEVLAFLREREAEWRWWNHSEIRRPMVSLVAVKSSDPFEAGRPETGAAIRVRCAWQNTPQGLLKTPISELIKLTVDGQDVQPKLTRVKAPRGELLADHYYSFPVAAGRHTAIAHVRVLDSKLETSRTLTFEA